MYMYMYVAKKRLLNIIYCMFTKQGLDETSLPAELDRQGEGGRESNERANQQIRQAGTETGMQAEGQISMHSERGRDSKRGRGEGEKRERKREGISFRVFK